MSERYNGYTNYGTWVVHLHMTNDEGDNAYWEEAARECLDEDVPRYALADRMQAEFDDSLDSCCKVPGVFGDLLRAAVQEVNWDEIAGQYILYAQEAADA